MTLIRIDSLSVQQLKSIDSGILGVALRLITEAYESFHFHRAYKELYDFCNEELSMYYLDMVKGRLYTYPANSSERRSAQTAIYILLGSLVRVMAPILTFTSEEIWREFPKKAADASITSVHLLAWPEVNFKEEDRLDLRSRKELEEVRK